MNVKITIEYIGQNYSGWQRQEDRKTVQGKIEEALFHLTGEEIEIFGSGRTDAGVHALGQVANFQTSSKIPADRIKYALNYHLPDDIRILSSEEVDQDFHSRFSAVDKTYIYRLQTGDIRRAFERDRSYFVKGILDLEKMREKAKDFIGEHDFSAFKTEGSSAKNFERIIYFLEIVQSEEDIVEIRICGNGFLYNMVRIISGTLVEIGKGRDYDIPKILQSKDRSQAGPTAPAQGLYLKEVSYEERK